MRPVTDTLPHQILSREDRPAAEVINASGAAGVCLVCEHASANIPASLGTLGLTEKDRNSHAVWDPGASDLAQALSALLDAPLVLARVSRLVHDCNRPPDRSDAMPDKTETIEISGNRNLSPEERAARTREVYDVFHNTLSDRLDAFKSPPALVTVHSFTPEWFGSRRETEIGLLHDIDDRMARAMLSAAPEGFSVALNQPYSAADGVTHMLARHAIPRQLNNVMIEVRNDLLASRTGIETVAGTLYAMILAALDQADKN